MRSVQSEVDQVVVAGSHDRPYGLRRDHGLEMHEVQEPCFELPGLQHRYPRSVNSADSQAFVIEFSRHRVVSCDDVFRA
jgi:hypothetical protein